MTTENVLTDEQIKRIALTTPDRDLLEVVPFARAIEQAVLQSPEIQGLKEDAERYRWLKANIQDGYELPGGYYIPDEDTHTWDKTIDAAMEKQP